MLLLAPQESHVQVIVDYNDLREFIGRIPRGLELHICSIDGHRGSRKSWVATRLAKDLGLPCISTDAYRIRKREGLPYVDQLSVEALAAEVARYNGSTLILLEGICIGWTLQRMHLTASTRVYCKRMTQAGLWADDLENYVTDGTPDSGLSPFDTEVVVYHLETWPDLNANVIYPWNGDGWIA